MFSNLGHHHLSSFCQALFCKTLISTMKFVVCALLLALAVGSMAAPNGNGRPGCKTEQEISDKVYRNFWDPTAYWVCSELNTAATAARCPDEELFQFSLRKCVPYDEWIWEPLVPQLSKPDQ